MSSIREISIDLSFWDPISIRCSASLWSVSFVVRVLLGAKDVDVRSLDLFRVTISDQSLISQLYPVTFTLTTQSFPSEQSESGENSASNGKSSTTAFRSIIPKVLTKNVLSSTSDNVQHLAHSNTNGLLSADDSQEQSSFYQHLTTTYRSLSWVIQCFQCERCTHPSCCVSVLGQSRVVICRLSSMKIFQFIRYSSRCPAQRIVLVRIQRQIRAHRLDSVFVWPYQYSNIYTRYSYRFVRTVPNELMNPLDAETDRQSRREISG